jgi:hypothetical protein
MKTANYIIVPMLFLLLSVAGCGRESRVTGTWKNTSLPETVDFRKDHTGSFTVQNNPSLPFTWKELPDGRIEVNINFMGNVRTLYGKMEKDTFVLSGKGEQAVYNKVK